MEFELGEETTTVTGKFDVKPNYVGLPPSMILDGKAMKLVSVKVNNVDFPSGMARYKLQLPITASCSRQAAPILSELGRCRCR